MKVIVKEWQEKHKRESSLSQVSRLSLPAPSQASYTIGQPSEMDFSANYDTQWLRGMRKMRNSTISRSSWSNNIGRRGSKSSKGRRGRSLGNNKSGLASRVEIIESIDAGSSYAMKGNQPENVPAYLKAVRQPRTMNPSTPQQDLLLPAPAKKREVIK